MPTTDERLDAAAAIPVTDPNSRYVRLLQTNDYAEAQAIVDRLSDRGFGVHHTAIVGEGLRVVERITGRMDWIRALIDGVINGFGTGLLIGILLSLFALHDPGLSPATIILVSLAVGAVLGAIVRLLSYLATGGHRDFTSIQSLSASTYSVLCHEDFVDKARELLSE